MRIVLDLGFMESQIEIYSRIIPEYSMELNISLNNLN